jgi:hypothetical protein
MNKALKHFQFSTEHETSQTLVQNTNFATKSCVNNCKILLFCSGLLLQWVSMNERLLCINIADNLRMIILISRSTNSVFVALVEMMRLYW